MAAAVRHRVKILDAGFLLSILAVIVLFAFEIDVFHSEGTASMHEQTVELDELMVITTITMAGILFYSWRRAREHQRENARRIAAEKEILTLALQDPLTGLPNRRQFEEALKSALDTVPAAPEAHAVLMLDLNGFKRVNDLYGHGTGDQLLIAVGARLLRSVRDRGDLVARLGGDEFAIIARNLTGAAGASALACRIIESLADPIVIGSIHHNVGTSIGIALAPHDGSQASELLRKADVALYRAKEERRSAARFFEPEMDAHLHERDELERALPDAYRNGEFELRFLPVTRANGTVAAYDAIPYWHHATRGLLAPERFLPIAEEIGILHQLFVSLLREGCGALRTWPDGASLSIDLPAVLMRHTAFAGTILTAVAESGVAPARLTLEIDEGALARDADAAQAFLGPLRAVGIRIVADHFGTGYSDLKNLSKLALDGVKIDHSFISTMTGDQGSAVLVKAMIGIARGLGLEVVADGVRTEEQRAMLAEQEAETAMIEADPRRSAAA